MLSITEKDRLETIFSENKIKKKKPTNMNQLASIIGVTRQCLYFTINSPSNASPTLLKLKDWIKKQTGIKYKNILKVYDYKVNELLKYGFKKNENGIYETEIYEKNNIKCKLIVDQNLILKLNFITEESDSELIDEILVIIFKLSKDRIVKIDLSIK